VLLRRAIQLSICSEHGEAVARRQPTALGRQAQRSALAKALRRLEAGQHFGNVGIGLRLPGPRRINSIPPL